MLSGHMRSEVNQVASMYWSLVVVKDLVAGILVNSVANIVVSLISE